jgi:excisionase family DNA binding protein
MLETLQPPRMATINETARITGLAKHFLRQLALQDKIKHLRAGKKILINVDKLIEYLNECAGVHEG